jgi:hypothetical protein
MEKQILELLKNKKNQIFLLLVNNENKEDFLQHFSLDDKSLIMYLDEDAASNADNPSYIEKILPYKQFKETNELMEILPYPFDYHVIGINDENNNILALTCKIKETSKFFNPELLLIEDEFFCKAVADFKNIEDSVYIVDSLSYEKTEDAETNCMLCKYIDNIYYDDSSEFILNREVYNIPSELIQLFAGNVNVNVLLISVSEPRIEEFFKLKSEDLVILESAYGERSIGHYSDFENRDDYAEKLQFAYVAIIIHHGSPFNVKCVASTSELIEYNVYWEFENVLSIDENFLKRTVDILGHSQSALVPSEYDENDEESFNNFDVTDENRNLNYFVVENQYGDIRDAYQYEQLNEWFRGIEE